MTLHLLSNGDVFGQLMLIDRLDPVQARVVMRKTAGDFSRIWNCVCVCGRVINLSSNQLRTLAHTSCGDCVPDDPAYSQPNRTNTTLVRRNRTTKSVLKWAEEHNIHWTMLHTRLFKFGWNLTRALNVKDLTKVDSHDS
jgi:hypothetical protein